MEAYDQAREEHRSFLERHREFIADAARSGFRSRGRGAVFVFEDAILEASRAAVPALTVEYVAEGSDALTRRGGWPTDAHAELVRGYDPAYTIIVLVGRRPGGTELFTYQLVTGAAEPGEPPSVWLEDLFG